MLKFVHERLKCVYSSNVLDCFVYCEFQTMISTVPNYNCRKLFGHSVRFETSRKKVENFSTPAFISTGSKNKFTWKSISRLGKQIRRKIINEGINF